MKQTSREPKKRAQPSSAEFHVVGIGASAGGLEALEAFFRAIPSGSGLAYVVIQHLSPVFKSHMEELLSRHTSIPIRRVENGVQVEPNTIYLIPAKMEMVISDGKLLITERSSDRAMIHPIDQFFRSLAADVGRYAIGVILSGTGSDGSRGIKDIHDAGGLVLVQDESTAKFDGMPMSATATGKVDLILPPAAIAEALVRYTKDGVTKDKLMEEDLAFSSMEGVEQISSLLNRRYGIDFSQYKPGTVGRRITRRLQLLGLDALPEYVERLGEDEQELNKLYEDLLIGVTKFFRDPEAFTALNQHVIERLLQDSKTSSIRIWVAACASGEEAYSIAMLIDEAMQRLNRRVDVKIFATDAHSGSLQKAAKGFFLEQALVELSEDRRQRYFRRNSEGYQVTRELRDYIVFAPHNIINDAPFTQMDLVTCRNMLIYLQPAAQKKALAMFHFALKPNGVLFLGPSESPGELSDEFKAIEQRWRLYTKRRDVRLPLGTIVPAGRRMERMPYATSTPQLSTPYRVDRATIAMYDQLLSKKIGACILVSEQGEMLHIFGGAERFLKPRRGRPSNHLLEMVDESLRSAVSVAFHHATTKGETVRNVATRYDGRDGAENVTILVEPLNDGGSDPNNILVSIEATRREVRAMTEDEISVNEMNRSRVEGLETELKYSQENLQAALEEMETSNEELQASNEELVASNEELQSTNEELHSVNEELYTVNAEHQRRVEELALANDDMDNLLATTRVGVIFLDQDLYIRRFTPEIARVFHLTVQDTGRSMEHVSHVLNHPYLTDELREVLKSHEELECKVTDREGTPYLLRALPYRSGDTTEGLVLTLIDITSLAKAEAEIELQRMAIESAVNGIIITDPQDNHNPIRYANRGFMTLTGYRADEVLGRDCRFLQCEETDPEAVRKIRTAVARAEPVRVTLLNQRKDGTRFWNDLHITPMLDANGKAVHCRSTA
jgi:two-component system, chemotaxis family, CheB/CheR fusion protein